MDDRVLVLTPHGRDAAVASELLRRNVIEPAICESVDDLLLRLQEGAGAALVAEEAIAVSNLDTLVAWLDNQPPWSDFPFVVLANGHKGVRSSRAFATLDRMRNV